MKNWKQRYYWPIWRFFRGLWVFLRYDFSYGIRNLIVYFPLIWRDRDWDQAYLVQLMEFKFRKMAEIFEKYSIHVGAEKSARQLRVCEHLCKRLYAEDYYENACKRFDARTAIFVSRDLQRQDKEMLGKLIGKYIDHWWD